MERGGEEDGGVREEGEEGVEAVGGGRVVTAAEELLEVRGRERRRSGWSGSGSVGERAGCGEDKAVAHAGVGEAVEHERPGDGESGGAARLRRPGGRKAGVVFQSPIGAALRRRGGEEGARGRGARFGLSKRTGRQACTGQVHLFKPARRADRRQAMASGLWMLGLV